MSAFARVEHCAFKRGAETEQRAVIKFGCAQRITVKVPSGNVVYTATGGMCVSDGRRQQCDYGICHPTSGSTAGDDFTHVTCENLGIMDASQDPMFRWDSVFSGEAWDWVVSKWEGNPSPGGLNFTEQVYRLRYH
ncbi:Glycosyl hydrolase family 71 [Geosmithia morbida]|uniref:Glycosyl hydrolase family 71 n=1 Tax=Geosmithia morbida TaxID=1094350 RepID=A0A9P4YXG4_9HYPO|nr:Glycosyl hydrolase family 71 [Geosmithia morbida]KAF4123592.1 Glycosyl hydrolase family 71 [Geosmithia morbida]